jgi:hypothetical protein
VEEQYIIDEVPFAMYDVGGKKKTFATNKLKPKNATNNHLTISK